MLLSFSIKNWRAFKNETSFSLKASKERFGSDHNFVLPPIYRKAKVLPLAAIYGANASGKTSFLEALGFVQNMVVSGMPINQKIPVNPYLLSRDSISSPSEFEIELFAEGVIYKYRLAFSQFRVTREELHSKNSRDWEVLFTRNLDSFELCGKCSTDQYKLIEMNTRPNQLFLHNAISLNANDFLPVYNWFANSLQLLGVDAEFNSFSTVFVRNDFKEFINNKLRKYKTGIEGIELQQVSMDSIPIPRESIEQIILGAPDGVEETTVQLRVNDGVHGSNIYIISMSNSSNGGVLTANKIILQHRDDSGNLVPFELSNESRGTQHLLELLPIFFDMASLDCESNVSKVYLVDELDQSFHSSLTYDLLKEYLDNCTSQTKHQLIFTLHDLMLMDKKLLRKDEMWFCDKKNQNEAEMFCLGNIDGVRTDTDVLKNYIEGDLGNCPKF